MRRAASVGLLVLAVSVQACASDATHNPAAYVEGQAYQPTVDPANFGDVVDNPYFPLAPGTVYTFEGSGEHVEVTVTHDTKAILGVTTIVVHDQVTVDGAVTEDTLDWYAQDKQGNVWYMGEQTAEYENGVVTSTEGTWEAGVDGAQPGIVMLADPQVGDTYRQEWYVGQAEDLAKVFALDQAVTVPDASYTGVVVTEEWTPLTPDVIEHKSYAPGIGVVYEEQTQGGTAALSLIGIQTGQ
jgi:hypothetical protein